MLLQPIIYTVLALVFWIPGLYFFVSSPVVRFLTIHFTIRSTPAPHILFAILKRRKPKKKEIISVVEQIAGTIAKSQHGLQGGAIFLIVHLFIHIKLNISPVDFLYTLLWSGRCSLGQHYYLNHALFFRFWISTTTMTSGTFSQLLVRT